MEFQALRLVVILLLCLRALDLKVRYSAVALGCRNLAVPQKILDGNKGSIGVKRLCSHGVAKPMTRDIQAALSRSARFEKKGLLPQIMICRSY